MLGFSLSPGGLLLPYHLGVLASLSHHGYLTQDTPIAGSSAGAIAVASHACGVSPNVALEASMKISSRCNPYFLARGQLMPSLRHELNTLLPKDANDIVNARSGTVGLAHFELFPRTRPVLQTQRFETRECLMDAVCDSSMFPYFTSNRPFRMVKRPGKRVPRIVVDGVFTEPLWRFGCPDMDKCLPKHNQINRSISVSVFPMDLIDLSLTAKSEGDRRNVISPQLEPNLIGQVGRLGRLACTPGDPKDLMKLYDDGWADAERWVRAEEKASQHLKRS